MSDNPFGFLWQDEAPEEPAIKVPVGGDFVTGFAGRWTVRPFWKYWAAEGILPEEVGVAPDAQQKLNNGTNLYWLPQHHAEAVQAKTALNQQYGPAAILRWELPHSHWLNIASEENRANFGDPIANDVQMTSLYGTKMHEYQLLFLPSLVQEMALVGGLLKERIFEYEGLETDNEQVSLDYQTKMIGTDKEYELSELWKARVAIWAALGEPDPRKFTTNQKGKSDTDSKALAACLSFVTRPETIVWARLVRVANPKMPKPDKKAFGVIVVAKLWQNEAAARAEIKSDESTEASPNGKVYPPMPEQWAGASPQDWIDQANQILEEYKGKPKPVVLKALKGRDKQLQETYAVSAADFERWWDLLQR